MTGFGRASFDLAGKTVNVEIKSLNSKSLDLGLRMPAAFREKEAEIRNLISQKLERGKVELIINIDDQGAPAISFNKELALQYYKTLKSLGTEINQPEETDYLSLLIRLPDVFKSEASPIDDGDWSKLQCTLNEVIQIVNQFRYQEGSVLETDLRQRIGLILQYLNETESYEMARIEFRRERIRKALEEIIGKERIDLNRMEQEIVYYIEKIDFTEEKIRLQKHCDYFLETLKQDGSNGRKLGFVTQEIGREINTLGSKANDADIQRLVVTMKDELEKIKEQLANIL